MRRALPPVALAALGAVALVAAGCASHPRLAAIPVAHKHLRTIRVALSDFRWPLDPALASNRNETTLARALYATPLRTDQGDRIVPGLCTDWAAADGFRAWRFHCRNALEIAAELRRVARLHASPANWIFSTAAAVVVPRPGTLFVRLRFPWRRFPYALTTIASAPRGVPGPFRLVTGSNTRVVLRGNGITLVFVRMDPRAAVRAFLHGNVDEAPVPLGDVGRFRATRGVLHVQPLLALDAIVFRGTNVPPDIRRTYWQTADRADYQALVFEDGAATALSVVGANEKPDPAAFRRAVNGIPKLQPVPVRIAVPPNATLDYGARILFSFWRELGLGPQLVPIGMPAEADLVRAFAVYPQEEAVLGALGLPTALGADDQHAAFDELDGRLRNDATVIPISWVSDARLVSPSLVGWHENDLGDADYTQIR